MTKDVLLEALLFYKGEPTSVTDLANAIGESVAYTEEALRTLQGKLEGRGITLVIEGGRAGLATALEAKDTIEALRREELAGPIGKAGLETLSIVIYKGPVSKSEIEYVRGVNSSSIIRTLLMRGLIEKVSHPSDKRSFLYRATPDLVASLGLTTLDSAPDFETTRSHIEAILTQRVDEEHA